MNTIFNFQTQLQASDGEISDLDLALIHKYAAKESAKDDFFVRRFVAINDRPLVKDGIKLSISKAFQERHLEAMHGLPFQDSHSVDRKASIGRIFKAELRTLKDGTTETLASVFIPLKVGNDEVVRRINLGLDRQVSLAFRFSEFKEVKLDGSNLLKILPSESSTDGPTELSLIGVGAHRDAVAASADVQLSDDDKACLDFGRQEKAKIIDDVVSYEKRLGIVQDMKLAADSYQVLSPTALKDKRDSLLKVIQAKEKQDTQVSLSYDQLNKELIQQAILDEVDLHNLPSPFEIAKKINKEKT